MNVEEEAKKIMDDFIKELDKVVELEDVGIKRERMLRSENAPSSDEGSEFRTRIFDNAPHVEKEQFKMERKHW